MYPEKPAVKPDEKTQTFLWLRSFCWDVKFAELASKRPVKRYSPMLLATQGSTQWSPSAPSQTSAMNPSNIISTPPHRVYQKKMTLEAQRYLEILSLWSLATYSWMMLSTTFVPKDDSTNSPPGYLQIIMCPSDISPTPLKLFAVVLPESENICPEFLDQRPGMSSWICSQYPLISRRRKTPIWRNVPPTIHSFKMSTKWRLHTVDGSEIPFPTFLGCFQNTVNNGINYHSLNWWVCRKPMNHQQYVHPRSPFVSICICEFLHDYGQPLPWSFGKRSFYILPIQNKAQLSEQIIDPYITWVWNI